MIEKLKKILGRCLSIKTKERLIIMRHRLLVFCAYIKYYFNWRKTPIDYYNIPIIINNFNRLGYLKKLLSSLEKRGYTNIYIIDNNSSYPPLLEYYKSCPYTIFKLNKNVGYKAIWETGIYEMFKDGYYVYSDSDMEIDELCPNNFMEHFVKILQHYKTAQKVGFGIKIDDLPDSYPQKNDVIEWEKQFWDNEIESGLFVARIDTTFALYRPYCHGADNPYQKVYRTGTPFLIKHLPWYNLSDFKIEDDFYLSKISTSTHWSVLNKT